MNGIYLIALGCHAAQQSFLFLKATLANIYP
jgi:hypothetical protein